MNSDENSDSDSEYELDQIEENYEPMNEEEHPQYASYPLEKKKEIVEFWRGRKDRKRKTLKQVQHRYFKITSTTQLYRWESQLDGMRITF